MGLIPAGAYANRKHTQADININKEIPKNIEDVLFDPQTSGGLLISVREDKAEELLKELVGTPTEFALIGSVIEKQDKWVIVE